MKKRSLISVCAMVVLTIALSVSALAASSVQDQMAANSAAWWVAYNAGDTATCDSLHQANVDLANSATSGGGSASYNSAAGTWTMTDSSGNTTSSSGSSNGKTNTAIYTTVSSSGRVSSSTSTSYTDSSISAYMNHGGTNQGLVDSYNNAATVVSETGNYGDKVATTLADTEVAVAKQILGLTDAEAAKLQADLESAKSDYDAAQSQYTSAMERGDTAAAEAARAAMDAAHDEAQSVRSEYNYSGDSAEYTDGGYYYGDEPKKPSGGGGFFTISITRSYTIAASNGNGGTISPSGSKTITSGGSCTYTITPKTGFDIADVLVDGVSVGKVSTYTFSNIQANHTIMASFKANGSVSMDSSSLYDINNRSLRSGTIKSGYGVFARIEADYSNVENVTVTATYNFGSGTKVVTLEETTDGVFQFPANSASPSNQRCVYIPATTADGTYQISFEITGVDAEGNELNDTLTERFSVLGSMYEDDFTGDR
jgi:hypothetical protein